MKLGTAVKSRMLLDRTLRRTYLQDLVQVTSLLNLTMPRPQKAPSSVQTNLALTLTGEASKKIRAQARILPSSPTFQTVTEKCQIVSLRSCAQMELNSNSATIRKKRVVSQISIATWQATPTT